MGARISPKKKSVKKQKKLKDLYQGVDNNG